MPEELQGLIQSISDTVRDVVEGVTSEFHNIMGGSFSITKHAIPAIAAPQAEVDDDEDEDEEDDEEDGPQEPPRFDFSVN